MLKLRPNCECCNRDLPRRPVRPAAKLVNNPASTERVFKPQGCHTIAAGGKA